MCVPPRPWAIQSFPQSYDWNRFLLIGVKTDADLGNLVQNDKDLSFDLAGKNGRWENFVDNSLNIPVSSIGVFNYRDVPASTCYHDVTSFCWFADHVPLNNFERPGGWNQPAPAASRRIWCCKAVNMVSPKGIYLPICKRFPGPDPPPGLCCFVLN